MNPDNTFAFLISVGKYDEGSGLHDLDQSFDNMSTLYSVLRGDLIGIPRRNIDKEEDPRNKTDLLTKIANLIDNDDAENLIIYYSGHGEYDEHGNHYLTLSNTTLTRINLQGLTLHELSNSLSHNIHLNVILILDSCFSANAFDSFNPSNQFIMASSARSETSKFPIGEEYSAFTNELIETLTKGIDNPGEEISWDNVYEQVEKNLVEKEFPKPQKKTQGGVEKIPAAKNAFHITEVNMDEQWMEVITNDITKNNPIFKQRVDAILNAGGPKVVNKLKEQLLNNFPYPIAFYLNKVFEKDPPASTYIQLYENSIKFLGMVLLIQFETVFSDNKVKNGKKFKMLMDDFKQPDHTLYSDLIMAISDEFENSKIDSFLTGFNYKGKEFQSIVKEMESLTRSKDKDKEKLAANALRLVSHLDFLLNYKLLSVKDVNLNYRKYDQLKYNHSVSLLQGTGHTQYEVWDELPEDWQKAFVRHETAKNNRSVILVDCNHSEDIKYLNMWPMIIDKNVLNQKATTPEVYMYSREDGKQNYLYHNIRDSEVLEMKTYNQLEAFAPTGNINMFKERIIHGPKKSD